MEKLSVSKFDEIRNRISHTIDEARKSFSSNLLTQILDLQDELLKYDLSDIPFEKWEGFQIISNNKHVADFSKTKANIDFDIVEYYGNGNFKGCNVRNLNKIRIGLDPSSFDAQTISDNQDIFLDSSFNPNFQRKFYNNSLTIGDLSSLSDEQLKKLEHTKYKFHIARDEYVSNMIDILGLDKTIKLFNYSYKEYEAVAKILNDSSSIYLADTTAPVHVEFLEKLQKTSPENIKNACFEFKKKQIEFSRNRINISDCPQMFIDENKDLFLIDADIPADVKKRYFDKELSINDIINYSDAFGKVNLDYFVDANAQCISKFILENYGVGKFQMLVKEHPDLFTHISDSNEYLQFGRYLEKGKDLDTDFTSAVKKYFLTYGMTDDFEVLNAEGEIVYNLPYWLNSMDFRTVDRLSSIEELLNYDNKIFILNESEQNIVNLFNIENIKKLEKDTKIFSHKTYDYSRELEMFHAFSTYFNMAYVRDMLKKEEIDFKNGSLSYEEFLDNFAKSLDHMRRNNIFTDYPDYDWIEGDFREKYPNIFMDKDAPLELKNSFYKNNIIPATLCQHEEYIPYLLDRDLSKTLKLDMRLSIPGQIDENGNTIPAMVDFVKNYTSRYGNKKFLNLILKYGPVISNITINGLHSEIDDEDAINRAVEQALRDSIYRKIMKGSFDFSYLKDIPELTKEYPEIFVNMEDLPKVPSDVRVKLMDSFYRREISFDDIKKYPGLMVTLNDKNLTIAFGKIISRYPGTPNLIQTFGNEKFLKLCANYGRYMEDLLPVLAKKIDTINSSEFEIINSKIQDIMAEECKSGRLAYYPVGAPEFLKAKYPELFLSDDAPSDLRDYFYNYYNIIYTPFKTLSSHKEWLPFLEGKAINTALLRNYYMREEIQKFFDVFGEEKAIKLGISRAETVDEIIMARQVELMKKWYDKTGGKFVPDFVVMQNFRLEEADKFLVSGSVWSNLMRNKNYASSQESRDAMLKIAYSFGAFDHDQRGIKELQELLTGLPRIFDSEYGYIFNQIEAQIDMFSNRDSFFNKEKDIPNPYEKMIEYMENNDKTSDLLGSPTVLELIKSIKKENLDIDFTKNIFGQLYRKNDDNTYSLTINQQIYPETSKAIRTILELFIDLPMITPRKAHQFFGGFALKYNPDFREFLLSNMDKIYKNPEYISLISNIQKQFSEIKLINNNRKLTWELAVSYVQSNKYSSVDVGNEMAAEISSTTGYSQSDFNTLQQIYNYGKQRTFSSIPRISRQSIKKLGKYTYEMLRLDDPYAMCIGTLTDCCQELNNCAEVCMEHSMVSKNGRIFTIRDDQGIVAQSWVWRNKDVLCFDNIEIPDKAFARAEKAHPGLLKSDFTDEIFELYKQAAHDLIIEDEKVYQKLLDEGKITEEQYDGLRLGKITVGLGYNDIADSLRRNTSPDKENITRPLPFDAPVKLTRNLYTNDSLTQYVIEEREGRKEYEGDTLPVYNDTYIKYDDSNFDSKKLLTLEKLEIATKGYIENLEFAANLYEEEKNTLVTTIAKSYKLNPETSRIIMNPNFAIIYDINNGILKVADLFFNTYINNEINQMDIKEKVIMQIRLAFDQISDGNKIDISSLNEEQKEIYSLAMNLQDEIDIERGVKHV